MDDCDQSCCCRNGRIAGPASATQQLKIPGVVYRPLLSKISSCIEVWTKEGLTNPAVRAFLAITKEEFGLLNGKNLR
jgi:hypothetical protein